MLLHLFFYNILFLIFTKKIVNKLSHEAIISCIFAV